MTNKYLINTVTDLYTISGFLPDKDCYKTFLQEREPKDPYSHAWDERNGKQYDLSSPIKFHDRLFKLSGVIKAANRADYKVKLNALKTAIYPNGRSYTIKSIAADETVTVFTKKITPDPIARFNSSPVYIKIEIELQEVQPA